MPTQIKPVNLNTFMRDVLSELKSVKAELVLIKEQQAILGNVTPTPENIINQPTE